MKKSPCSLYFPLSAHSVCRVCRDGFSFLSLSLPPFLPLHSVLFFFFVDKLIRAAGLKRLFQMRAGRHTCTERLRFSTPCHSQSRPPFPRPASPPHPRAASDVSPISVKKKALTFDEEPAGSIYKGPGALCNRKSPRTGVNVDPPLLPAVYDVAYLPIMGAVYFSASRQPLMQPHSER